VESSQCSPEKIYWTFVVHTGSHFHDCAVHVSWTFREFVSPKLHRPDFARWVSSRAAIAIDYAKFFSRSHHAAFSKKTGSPLGRFKKHLAISPIPLPSIAAP
jgi:hypothetical protein